MIEWPRALIVDAPTASATVLYAATDKSLPGVVASVLADGFTVGAPSLAGDPDAPGVQWGLRRLGLTQGLLGSKPAAMARQSVLARVLMRPRFWLMFQLDQKSAPVWWHCYRSQPGDLSFENVRVDESAPDRDDRWSVGVVLDADPFGFGARLSLAAVTVGGNPAVDSPPAWGRALAPLTGDAPAGLRVSVTRTDGASSLIGSNARLIAVASTTDADPTALLKLADAGFTAGADTVVTAARRVTTFTTTAVVPRVTGTVTTVTPGTYTAFLRASAGALTTAARTVSTTLQVAGVVAQRKVHSFDAGVTSLWMDLGPVTVGRRLPTDLPNTAQSGPLSVQIGSNVTGWSLTYDHLLLVPVSDDRAQTSVLRVSRTDLATGAPTLVVDADTEDAWLTGTDPANGVGSTGSLPGGGPFGDPAAGRNTLLFLAGSVTRTTTALPDAQHPTADGATYSLGVSYHPRVVWLGDGTPSPLAAGTP